MEIAESIIDELNDEHYENKPRVFYDDCDPLRGNHLPVARVKKIMKEGEHQGMISSDAPVILAKACEMLIRDLTLQSWDCTQMTKRCTLQGSVRNTNFGENIQNNLQMGFNSITQGLYSKDTSQSNQRNLMKSHPYKDYRQNFNCSQSYQGKDVGNCTNPIFVNSTGIDQNIQANNQEFNYFTMTNYGVSSNQFFMDKVPFSPKIFGQREGSDDEPLESFQTFTHNSM